MTLNQNPEQKARDHIDKQLHQAGWVIQNKKQIKFDAGIGQAVREYQTDTKTLIFAKTDSHADDIIQIVREEFDEGDAFCKKVTYKADDDPKSTLADFRNAYYPRIAVTVDMIATGTDIKVVKIVVFMRAVKSPFFEQMEGRVVRIIEPDVLRKEVMVCYMQYQNLGNSSGTSKPPQLWRSNVSTY